MLWLERQLLCNSFVLSSHNRYKVFAVYGLRTLVMRLRYCLCMCVSVCVASTAFEGYVTKPRDTLWNFHSLAAANLSLVWSRQSTFRLLDIRSFRMIVTKKTKERKKGGEIIIIKKNAICCSLCMCCQTIKLQPGAQFPCYTQVYQVLLMLCQKRSDVRWNFLTQLTENDDEAPADLRRWKHRGTLAHILVPVGSKKNKSLLYWKQCII